MKQLSFGEKLNQCITYTSNVDGFQVSFEKLCEYFPEFEKMKTVMQRPDWHQEGSVFNHTKLAVEYFLEKHKDSNLGYYGYFVLIAILFHDIGKVFCPIGEDGYVKSGGHERLSEQYLKKMFFTTNDTFFSTHEMSLITTLVKHHDLRYKYKEMKTNTLNEAINEIKNVFRETNWLKYFSYVWDADMNGGRPSSEKQDENIETTIEFFKNRFCNPKPQMILMCGIPGSGKNYFIEHNSIGKVGFLELNPVIISRDDVRLELGIENGIGTDAEEKQVSKICDERLNEAIKNRRNIIINNTNLKYKYRKVFYDLAKSNNYETVLYFIRRDFDKVLEARPGDNWRNVINRMIENMDIPTNSEADFVREMYHIN